MMGREQVSHQRLYHRRKRGPDDHGDGQVNDVPAY